MLALIETFDLTLYSTSLTLSTGRFSSLRLRHSLSQPPTLALLPSYYLTQGQEVTCISYLLLCNKLPQTE